MMKPIVTPPVLKSSAHEFQFEDLFGASPHSPVEGSWPKNTPDTASSRIDACETYEEDIGEDQEYDDEGVEEEESSRQEESGGKEAGEQASPKSIKMNSNIGLNSFTTLSLVGKGGFGSVNQVVFKATNEILAMKTLKKKHLIKTKSVDSTIAEKDILRKVRHPFIVKLHYAFQSEDKVHLVMDFVNGGHLLHHMHSLALFSEQQARFYIAEVILALEHLHSMDIIHRDLKPENVLMDATGHCLLTDFGFAKENVLTPESCSSFCGTLEYMAPEVVKKNKYGKAADYWSVGILLYDMLCGHPPFEHKNDQQLIKRILNDKLKLPTYLSKEAVNLLKGLLNRDIKNRFTIKEIKSHKFFQGQGWAKMLKREIRPPIIPILSKGALDISNFDSKYTNAKMHNSVPDSPLSSSQQLQFQGFSYVSSTPSFLNPLTALKSSVTVTVSDESITPLSL